MRLFPSGTDRICASHIPRIGASVPRTVQKYSVYWLLALNLMLVPERGLLPGLNGLRTRKEAPVTH